MLISLPYLAAAAVIAVLVVIFAWRPWRPRIIAKPLMTPNEVEFFHRLREALPGMQVFPQVAFGALMTDDRKLSGQARWRFRASFDRKIADYVICNKFMHVFD